MRHTDAVWAYFAMLCLVAFGIAIGVLLTRTYYDAHCESAHHVSQP